MTPEWVPWQLAPDSDPQQRWILVNRHDHGEEHPRNLLFASQGNAEQYARSQAPCEHGNYVDECCALCNQEFEKGNE